MCWLFKSYLKFDENELIHEMTPLLSLLDGVKVTNGHSSVIFCCPVTAT